MYNFSTLQHPILVLIRGLPGSGKSYLAHAVREALGAAQVVSLDPDATDYTSQAYLDMSASLTKDGVDEKFHPYRFLRAQAYDGIEHNKVIIWNQAFTNLDGFQKTVVNLTTYAQDHGAALPLLVIEMEIDPAICKQRVTERAGKGGHDVNEEAFTRFISDYHSFASEGYNTITIDGQADTKTSVEAVLQALEKIAK